MYKLIAVLALTAAVAARDLTIGQSLGGKQLYHENITASPAFWRQTHTLTINATEGEVISGIIVKDNRPDKSGDVEITEGGEGQENVTIVLKSPAVFRGLYFDVEIYSVPKNEYVGNATQSPKIPFGAESPAKVPGQQETQEVHIRPVFEVDPDVNVTEHLTPEVEQSTKSNDVSTTTVKSDQVTKEEEVIQESNTNGDLTTTPKSVQAPKEEEVNQETEVYNVFTSAKVENEPQMTTESAGVKGFKGVETGNQIKPFHPVAPIPYNRKY